MKRPTAFLLALGMLFGSIADATPPPPTRPFSGPPTRAPRLRSAIPRDDYNTTDRPTVKQPDQQPVVPVPNVGGINDPSDPRFALTLADGTKLIGEPVGLAIVPVTTSFGTAKIPLKVVHSINAVPNATTVKVYFRNGDIVSGTLQAEVVSFQTPYGLVRVPVKDIVRLQHGATFPTPGRRPIVNYAQPRPSPKYGKYTIPYGGSTLPPSGYIPVRPDLRPVYRPR